LMLRLPAPQDAKADFDSARRTDEAADFRILKGAEKTVVTWPWMI